MCVAVEEVRALKSSATLLQVRIAPNWMSNTNQQVRARQLWGSDVYTEDSDLVAALMHSGFYSISLPACPPTVRPELQ
jgi:Histone deacetylation protein Rxt3